MNLAQALALFLSLYRSIEGAGAKVPLKTERLTERCIRTLHRINSLASINTLLSIRTKRPSVLSMLLTKTR